MDQKLEKLINIWAEKDKTRERGAELDVLKKNMPKVGRKGKERTVREV